VRREKEKKKSFFSSSKKKNFFFSLSRFLRVAMWHIVRRIIEPHSHTESENHSGDAAATTQRARSYALCDNHAMLFFFFFFSEKPESTAGGQCIMARHLRDAAIQIALSSLSRDAKRHTFLRFLSVLWLVSSGLRPHPLLVSTVSTHNSQLWFRWCWL
jgi:hypothetical protein